MLSGIFGIVQLLLKLFGLWESWLSFSDAQRIADAAKKTAARDAAVDKQKGATSEEEFDKAQNDIVNNLP